jgi:hypothetical protein
VLIKYKNISNSSLDNILLKVNMLFQQEVWEYVVGIDIGSQYTVYLTNWQFWLLSLSSALYTTIVRFLWTMLHPKEGNSYAETRPRRIESERSRI